jgi:hypothetical protein
MRCKPISARPPAQALAERGYRAEAVFERYAGGATELVVALGRDGKEQLKFDAEKNPHTAAMAAKLQTDPGREAYRKCKVDRRAAQWLDQERPGISAVQPPRTQQGPAGMEDRLRGAESEANERAADGLRGPQGDLLTAAKPATGSRSAAQPSHTSVARPTTSSRWPRGASFRQRPSAARTPSRRGAADHGDRVETSSRPKAAIRQPPGRTCPAQKLASPDGIMRARSACTVCWRTWSGSRLVTAGT